MYCTAKIDKGGYIIVPDAIGGRESFGSVVHRESNLPFRHQAEVYETLQEAKEIVPEDSNPPLILEFNPGEGVSSVWCYAADDAIVRERLRIWSGCYGAWPVRRLNGTKPVSTV